MSPLFLFTILIPKIIVHDVSLTFIRVEQVKYCFFMGDEPQRYPIKQGSRKFLICGKRRKCGKPNSRASFFLQATSDEALL